MGKRIFILIVILMSISLIGIIAVQVYWINNAIESKKAQFKNDVKIALANVSERIKNREFEQFYRDYGSIFKNKKLASDAEIKNYLFQQIDTINNTKTSFAATVLEENFKIPVDFFR